MFYITADLVFYPRFINVCEREHLPFVYNSKLCEIVWPLKINISKLCEIVWPLKINISKLCENV